MKIQGIPHHVFLVEGDQALFIFSFPLLKFDVIDLLINIFIVL